MADEKYNGWENYPTWCTNLWITNDQGLYNYFREMKDHCSCVYDYSSVIASFFAEDQPDLGASLYADLLGYAFDKVNWYEIASALWDYYD